MKIRLIIQNVNIYENIYMVHTSLKFIRTTILSVSQFIKKQPMVTGNNLNNHFQLQPLHLYKYRDSVILIIDFTFKSREDVYICITIPFTYADNQQYLQDVQQRVPSHVKYQDQVIGFSLGNRNIHMLTITSREISDNESMHSKKPIILITARVHPGEVSSSFCLQGIIELLLSCNNLQAYLLVQLFTFKIFPLVNPDGVYDGNYRLDTKGVNLNRVYSDPLIEDYPSINKIIQIVKRIIQKNKIQLYLDLHSHSAIKQSFIYGNAFDDIVDQTYSELFCKVLEENYQFFKYSLSHFGEKQMKGKDKRQNTTKEGCGRVVISKLGSVIKAYTIQSSIFASVYTILRKNKKQKQRNNVSNNNICNSDKLAIKNSDFKVGQYQYIEDFITKLEDNTSIEDEFINENKYFGKMIIISMLDLLKKNPFTRFNALLIDQYLKQISTKIFQTEERFKLLDIKAYQKVKFIQKIIKEDIQNQGEKSFIQILHSQMFHQVEWPEEFKISPMINIPIKQKKFRVKTEATKSLKKYTRTNNNSQYLEEQINKQITQKDYSFKSKFQKLIESKNQHIVVFPEIKYSCELKSESQKKIISSELIEQPNSKRKETNFHNFVYGFLDLDEPKAKSQQTILKRSNASLNRLLAHKMLQKQKNRISTVNDSILKKSKNTLRESKQFQEIIKIKSKQRLFTEDITSTNIRQSNHRLQKRLHLNIEGCSTISNAIGCEDKGQQKKQKRAIFKESQIKRIKNKGNITKSLKQKSVFKLPDVYKINLVIENSGKKEERNT